MAYQVQTDDVERGKSPASDEFSEFAGFSEKAIRNAFIRKVYAILAVQLLVSCAFIGIFTSVDSVVQYCRSPDGVWLFYTSFGTLFVTMIALACCGDVRRRFPTNMILLGIFTVAMSFCLGMTASTYDPQTVLIAAGITAALTIGLTIFAFQTKIDFTGMGVYLFVILLGLFVFGIVCAIVQNQYANIAYASIGALLFCMYLVFDTQLMLGGSHKYSISPEEYVFAALNLYLDVINLFMMILSLLGGGRR